MIGRIRGTLVEKQPPELLVDVQGVGYEVHVPMSTVYQLPDTGREVLLHTHLVVREDAQLLYGFFTTDERHMFRSLIRISGVGPKMALVILSGMAVNEFVRTVRLNDIAALTRMPGVGKKTAERLVVEMKDRLISWDLPAAIVTGKESTGTAPSAQQVTQDAETALIALGYKPQEAARLIAHALKLNPDLDRSEELIRHALKSAVQP